MLEDFILGLVAGEERFNNPFQVSDNIRREMIRQAEVSGSRALDWRLSSFNEIGGPNTLRRVWASLKGNGRVVGKKRQAEENEMEDDINLNPGAAKKHKKSSNVSSTCDRLGSILLSSSEDIGCSLDASTGEVFERFSDACSQRFTEYSEEPKHLLPTPERRD